MKRCKTELYTSKVYKFDASCNDEHMKIAYELMLACIIGIPDCYNGDDAIGEFIADWSAALNWSDHDSIEEYLESGYMVKANKKFIETFDFDVIKDVRFAMSQEI